MKALILLSHGSRMDQSNQEMINLANTVAEIDGTPFAEVHCAFQQFAQPTFEEVIAALVRKTLHHIVVFPLFLSSGNHVQVDVPEMIQRVQRQFPQLQITVMPHLGGTKDLPTYVSNSVLQHLTAE